MKCSFETDYKTILNKVDQIDPVEYGQTRNYIDGAVTHLSPYISRGVISTQQVLQRVLDKGYKRGEIESFVKELCWRDYFQRVGQEKNVNLDIKQAQHPVSNHEIPTAILTGDTGISGVDDAIKQLYETGYMHNHCRMYTASLACNVAQSHWLNPARWMYYHLLDGDFASNHCSWQWVAGANSNKKYIANQENINRFSHTKQKNTFLDRSYEYIAEMEIPDSLKATQLLHLKTELPVSAKFSIDRSAPTFVYNYYNLDPLWHANETGNRVFLLDPDFFDAWPVSQKCLHFALELSKNIEDVRIFVGTFSQLKEQWQLKDISFKAHPLNFGYSGNEESRDWIAEEIKGYFPSFFAYWKKVNKVLTN